MFKKDREDRVGETYKLNPPNGKGLCQKCGKIELRGPFMRICPLCTMQRAKINKHRIDGAWAYQTTQGMSYNLRHSGAL
jgi:hypothetical protein